MEHDECNFMETGVCGMHNVEIERRKSSEKIFKATSGLILLALGASFMYTTLSKQSTDISIQETRLRAETLFSELRSSQASANQSIADLSRVVARNEGALNPLIRELSDLNSALKNVMTETNSKKIRQLEADNPPD
jgi:hypothetical protein